MATDPRAKLVTLHFTQAGKTHGIRLEYGTALALGIDESKIGIGFVNRTVQGHTTSRRLYPGGPTVQASVATRVRPVAVGPGSGKARTNKKLIIKGNGENQTRTIYHSGPMQAAVAWLKGNANIAEDALGDGYSIYSPTGRPLSFKLKNG
jgi:hypothetical protein